MPIKPENRARYPKDWPAISRQAKERAGWRCVHPGCTAHQYAVGFWVQEFGGRWVWKCEWPRDSGFIGQSYADAREVAAGIDWANGECGPKPVVIVLTVAHLNHQPEDCRPENLAPMCQRHHLAHDLDHHRRTAYATRKAAAQTPDLFAA